MELISYQYALLRYVHDSNAGEALNIGVIVYAPQVGFLDLKMASRYSRLACAFPTFDSTQYLNVIGGMEASVERRARQLKEDSIPGIIRFEEPDADLQSVLTKIWGDPGLGYQFGETLGGVSDDLNDTLNALYYRFVFSQYEAPTRNRRDDRQVWVSAYQDALRVERITDHLQMYKTDVGDFSYQFDYAFKNGSWHALQPVALDYSERNGIRDRVDRIIGEVQVLARRNKLGAIYLLTGKPANSEYNEAYQEALSILQDTLSDVIELQIVREEDAESFAKRLGTYMRDHGIISPIVKLATARK